MNKPIESIIVPESEVEYWDQSKEIFIENAYWDNESESIILHETSNFYVLLATGDRCYYKTRDRATAQKQADEDWGIGKYKIRVVKDIKSKSKLENGGQSVYATATRNKPSSRPPK